MVNRAWLGELRQLAAEHRKTWMFSDYGKVPGSIPVLLSRAAGAEPDQQQEIYNVLVDECVRAGLFDLEKTFRRDLVTRFPRDPIPLCSLASCLVSHPSLHGEAKQCALSAIALARETNAYVRYSLTTLLRIAIQLGDYEIVNSTLGALLEDSKTDREIDYVFEFDFIDSIDQEKVDVYLLQKYLELTPRSGDPAD